VLKLTVTKYSGETAYFSRNRLKQSLLNSGADHKDDKQICDVIEDRIFDGITTKELYEIAFELLKNIKNSVAARYSLKRALQQLGPEGFYFEKWIAKVFERSEEHTSELQSRENLVCRLLLEKKKTENKLAA